MQFHCASDSNGSTRRGCHSIVPASLTSSSGRLWWLWKLFTARTSLVRFAYDVLPRGPTLILLANEVVLDL